MNKDIEQHEFLKIFNKNIPIKEQYTIEEIQNAFLKTLGTNRERVLYKRFFKECPSEECIKKLISIFKVKIQILKKLYESFSDEDKIEFGTFWSKRFRLPKVKGNFPRRSDDKYTEIDSFEKYELTPCIAYEMAIRNDKVKKLLDRYKKISTMLEDDQYILNIHMSKNFFAFTYGYVDQKELNEEYSKYEKLYEAKQATYKKLIKENYKRFIDDYINMCTELHTRTLMDLQQRIEDELINDYLIYPKGYNRQLPCRTQSIESETITNSQKEVSEKIVNNDNVDDGLCIRYEKITYKEFINYQSINTQKNEYRINNIIPNYKRQVNDQNQPILAINFSLPLDEIVEYVTKIKEQINPKTPLELLGEQLEKANDLTNLEAAKHENPQKRLSDMLYVYDMKKEGQSNTDIINEVDGYHGKLAYLRLYFDKYYETAKEYIENEKYKELITGKCY